MLLGLGSKALLLLQVMRWCKWACKCLQLMFGQINTQLNQFLTLLLLWFGVSERLKKNTMLQSLSLYFYIFGEIQSLTGLHMPIKRYTQIILAHLAAKWCLVCNRTQLPLGKRTHCKIKSSPGTCDVFALRWANMFSRQWHPKQRALRRRTW